MDSFFQLADKLSPYKKLYENATEFISKHEVWMNSQVGSHDPDEIDIDVGVFCQTIYKLEKVFAEQPAVKDLTSTVSAFFTFLCSRVTPPVQDSVTYSLQEMHRISWKVKSLFLCLVVLMLCLRKHLVNFCEAWCKSFEVNSILVHMDQLKHT